MGSFNQEQDKEKELEAFRQEWRKEVQGKKEHAPTSSSTNGHSKKTSNEEQVAASFVKNNNNLETQQQQADKEESEKKDQTAKTAMDHYVIAVENEREGKLGKALDGYRRAFKLDPNIDYAYKKHYQEHILPSLQSSSTQPLAPLKEDDEHHFKHVVPIGNEYTAPQPMVISTTTQSDAVEPDPLQHLIDQFLNEDELNYLPELDYKPVLISKLPNEIMLNVVRYIALYSISTMPYFALTCKKFFLYSRDPTVWQYACTHVFKEPYMTLNDSRVFQSDFVSKKFNGNWLRMFIDRPRIRYDGVYISTCHYIRPGTADTAWNQPVHLVTYYRYLRFFPNGTILKHLTTNEPSHVVRNLERHFSKQQSFHGTYKINNDSSIEIAMKDPGLPTEDFRLQLDIKTTHRGRHNKLNWIEYYSIPSNVDRDIHQFDLKMFKPFFFSPVRSYKVNYAEYDADLVRGVENIAIK